MDPITITTSSLALLSAAKAVCDLIARITDAPKVLSNAKDDAEQTITSVRSLCACLEDRPDDSVSGRDQLVNVLVTCRRKCEALQSQLEACSKHSAGSADGKLSLRDRGKLLIKDKEIEEHRRDIACFRGAINVAAFPLLLSSTMNSEQSVKDMTVQMKIESTKIGEHLENIRQRMDDLERAGVVSSNNAYEALESRQKGFTECQKLIEESVKAAEQSESFRATYGNLIVDASGRVFEGIATDQNFRNVDLAYKDTTIGRGGTAVRGLMDPKALEAFIATTAARSRSDRQDEDARD